MTKDTVEQYAAGVLGGADRFWVGPASNSSRDHVRSYRDVLRQSDPSSSIIGRTSSIPFAPPRTDDRPPRSVNHTAQLLRRFGSSRLCIEATGSIADVAVVDELRGEDPGPYTNVDHETIGAVLDEATNESGAVARTYRCVHVGLVVAGAAASCTRIGILAAETEVGGLDVELATARRLTTV